MIRTAPNLNLQNAKHKKHSENPNGNKTCIDSNINLNLEPGLNKQQNEYKRSNIRSNHQKKLCWRQNKLICTKLERLHHAHKPLTA